MNGTMIPQGDLEIKLIRANKPNFSWVFSNRFNYTYFKGWITEVLLAKIAKRFGLMVAIGKLEAVLIHADGTKVNYGVLSRRSITNAFVNFVAAQLVTDSVEIGDFKYHDSGVGTTAENVTDTAMETTDGESRATGNQTNPTSPTYRSVGTISYTTTKAITEHGLFSSASSTTLMDRSVFAAINVVNGDSIQFTYTLTLTAGG